MPASQIRTDCFIEINAYTYIMFRLHKFDSQLQCTKGETERRSDVICAEDSRREEIWPEAGANKANPCDVFAMLKENKDVMAIVEGNPGIGKKNFLS